MIIVNGTDGFFPNSCQTKDVLNGEKTIEFILAKTKENEHVFNQLNMETPLQLETEEYIIKEKSVYLKGNIPVTQVFGMHVFFELGNDRNDEELVGNISLYDALTFIFNDSNWKFKLFGDNHEVEKESFGNDNKLSLFTTILADWNVEYILDTPNRLVNIYPRVGEEVDYEFRYNHNIRTLKFTENSRELKTAIKGYGIRLTVPEIEPGSGVAPGTIVEVPVTIEYISPMAEKLGKKIWQEPVRDEKLSTEKDIEKRLKEVINDKLIFQVEMEVTQINDNYEPVIGDAVLTIHEPLDIDLDTRITEITRFPFDKTKKAQVVLSNIDGEEALKISSVYGALKLAQKSNKQLVEKYKKVDEKVAEADKKASEAVKKADSLGISQLKVMQGSGYTNTTYTFDKPFTFVPYIQITPTGQYTQLITQATKTDFIVYYAGNYSMSDVPFNWMVVY